MKKLFYAGIIGLTLFEIFNVYFIMPMPGSQHSETIQLAYFLYRFRWVFRIVFLGMIATGAPAAFRIRHKWIPVLACLPAISIAWMFNFKMTADKMFLQPALLTFHGKGETRLNDSTLVIAVEHNGQAKGYPIRYIVYHHQVRDVVAGEPVMVTYCSVCRTGRAFAPTVNGKPENFRLVGMDHFNAMFEDASTGSWWRQATGEAITGPLKGSLLPELESNQLTLGKFFQAYPFGQVMDADVTSKRFYDSLGRYEKGKYKGGLTGTDTIPWQKKSWVVGVDLGQDAKAYDWTLLRKMKVIEDKIGSREIALVVSDDSQSFAAFERPSGDHFIIRGDTVFVNGSPHDFTGKKLTDGGNQLKKINAYQEFWHSWQTFHPKTVQYQRPH